MSDLVACPPELAEAARPLRSAGELLVALADDRHGLEQLADGSPSLVLRESLLAFIDRWELLTVTYGGRAIGIAAGLERAAELYFEVDARLARDEVP